MPHTTFTVGRLRCHALEGGSQRLDGGAMFGVVPKPLWQRRIPADERNRIPAASWSSTTTGSCLWTRGSATRKTRSSKTSTAS